VSTVRLGELGEGKIQGWQRDRLAIVYVRQSSRQQVVDHGESTRLQYGLVDRAVALGWPASRVMVIDEDLGRSAADAAGRPGFARLVDPNKRVRQIAGLVDPLRLAADLRLMPCPAEDCEERGR
jgi:hypothetical protein